VGRVKRVGSSLSRMSLVLRLADSTERSLGRGGNFGGDLDQNAGAEREIGTGSDSDDDTPVVLAKLLQARILSPPEGHVFEDEEDVQVLPCPVQASAAFLSKERKGSWEKGEEK
jgi:hypothetical protein